MPREAVWWVPGAVHISGDPAGGRGCPPTCGCHGAQLGAAPCTVDTQHARPPPATVPPPVGGVCARGGGGDRVVTPLPQVRKWTPGRERDLLKVTQLGRWGGGFCTLLLTRVAPAHPCPSPPVPALSPSCPRPSPPFPCSLGAHSVPDRGKDEDGELSLPALAAAHTHSQASPASHTPAGTRVPFCR